MRVPQAETATKPLVGREVSKSRNRPGQEPRCPAILPCACRSRKASPAVEADAGTGEEGDRLREGLAARMASGPGLWLEELKGLDRRGLLEQLLAGDVTGEAVAAAPHGHRPDRVLTARNTLLAVIAGCLFAGQGCDQVLRTVFAMPGLDPPRREPRCPPGRRARRAEGVRAGRGPHRRRAGIGELWHGAGGHRVRRLHRRAGRQ
jgi:hypothetical protein